MEENREELELTAENQQDEQIPVQEAAGYTPRPKSQVWLARIGLVIFIIILIIYYATMFTGGGK